MSGRGARGVFGVIGALDPAERIGIATYLDVLDMPAGQPVVTEGAGDRDLYVCLAGKAVIIRDGVEVEHIGPGDSFGELGLILGTPRAASVVAKSPLRLARLSHASYRTLAQTDPALGLRLLEALLDGVAARLGTMSDSVGQLLRDHALPRRTHVQVRVPGQADRSVRSGTRASELLPEEVAGRAVVAALCDQKPVSLCTPITSSCALEPLTTASWEGQRIYRQSLSLLFLDAARHVARDLVAERAGAPFAIELAHSVGFARRVRVTSDAGESLPALASRIEAAMLALVERKLALFEELWSVDEAMEYFSEVGAQHTVALFRCWRQPAVPVCSYGGRYVLRTGPFVASTAALRDFGVVANHEGLLLLYGAQGTGQEAERASRAPDAADVQSVSEQTSTLVGAAEPWQRSLGIGSIGAFNRACIEGSVPRLIRVNEGFHEKAISRIADQIVERGGDRRIVCIAGPSSSGKTTFIERLKVQLHVNGKNPIGISLDDYYCDRERTPRDTAGELDFEALNALRLDDLQAHLARLLRGERVRTARYDFESGLSQLDGGAEIGLGADDLLLLEGIHALNPAILGEAGRGRAFLIFVCPLGQLPIDEVTRVHGSDLRLLRRIVRDRHSRATKAEANILRWPSVRRGERAHIFPFQYKADAVFDSGLVYELSVLKVFAERYLLEVPQTSTAYSTAFRLLALLDRLVTIYPDHVPQTSLLREFIGRSGYEY